MKDNYHTGNYVPYSSKSACVGCCTSHRNMKYEECETRWAYGLSFLSEKTRSVYHLNGIFGNSRKNSNGLVHPGGLFSFFAILPEFTEITRCHLSTFISAKLFTAILPRERIPKNRKNGGKFPNRLTIQCVFSHR